MLFAVRIQSGAGSWLEHSPTLDPAIDDAFVIVDLGKRRHEAHVVVLKAELLRYCVNARPMGASDELDDAV